MKHCPKCFSEWGGHVEKCQECGGDLVSGNAPKDARESFKTHKSSNRYTGVSYILLGVGILFGLTALGLLIQDGPILRIIIMVGLAVVFISHFFRRQSSLNKNL